MNHTTIQIRRTTPEDQTSLKPLMLAYIVDFYQRPAPETDRLHALIDSLQEGTIGVQFVAEDANGQLVGFVTVYHAYSTLRAQRTTVMNDLYVSESARGSGAAAALFEAARKYTRDIDGAFMSWETAADNARAQRFYEKMGGERGNWVSYSIS